jgi:hypothetical protein
MRNLFYLPNFLFLIQSILFIVSLSLIQSCSPSAKITKLSSKELLKLTKIQKFTVLITDKEGNQTIHLETNRAGFFFSKTNIQLKGMTSLNQIYGNAIQNVIRKIDQNKEIRAEFVNPEKLLLMYNEKGEEDLNKEWYRTMEIDAVFYIYQNQLSLDYMTRSPNLGGFNWIYTLLLLDLWYVDLMGEWFLKNDLTYTVHFPKSGKWFQVVDQSQSILLSTYNHKQITVSTVEEAILESFLRIFSGGKPLE